MKIFDFTADKEPLIKKEVLAFSIIAAVCSMQLANVLLIWHLQGQAKIFSAQDKRHLTNWD